MKKLLLLGMLIISANLFSQNQWVPFVQGNPDQAAIKLLSSDKRAVSFHANFYGMYRHDTTIDSITYNRLTVPGCTKTRIAGSPELPVLRQLIAIPECTGVSVGVVVNGSTSLSAYTVYPAPAYQEVYGPDSVATIEEVFTKDATVYDNNELIPSAYAEVISTGYLRGQKYAEVYVYPLQYNPVSGNMLANYDVTVTLSFVNPSGDLNANTGIFNNVATHTFLNYESSGITAEINDRAKRSGNVQWINLTDTSQAVNIVADYLIITDDIFYYPNDTTKELYRIARHRADYNGFDVAIVKVEDIMSLGFFYEGQLISDTTYRKEQRIRTFIKRVYQGAHANHTYDGMLAYVLLVGDAERTTTYGVPTSRDPNPSGNFYGHIYSSDYYYTCLTKNNSGTYDPYGEIYIGRFCVDNNQELHNIVKKTIDYETEARLDTYKYKNLFVNSAGIGTKHDYITNIYNPFINNLITAPYLSNEIDAYNISQQNLTKQIIVDSLNTGYLTMFYCGHGNNIALALYPCNNLIDTINYLTLAYLKNNLHNYYKYPFVYAYTCQNGLFDDPSSDCIAEESTTYNDTTGFIGYLGASFDLFLNISQNIEDAPQTIYEWVPYCIWNDLSHITGEFILESKCNTISDAGGRFGLNYFGDPALNLMAEGYQVTHITNVDNDIHINNEVHIKPGASLFVLPNHNVYFGEAGKLVVEKGAHLSLGGGTTVYGQNTFNKILVEGNISMGRVKFTAPSGKYWAGLEINNENANLLMGYDTIEHCNLTVNSDTLRLQRCSFNNSGLDFSNGTVYIDHSSFTDAGIDINTSTPDNDYAEIKNTSVSQCDSSAGINLENYQYYLIENDSVFNNQENGVRIFYGGSSRTLTHKIKNCIIINNGQGDTETSYGISVYHSSADIEKNYISGQDFGVVCLNGSNTSLKGDSTATASTTQRITNNLFHQVHTAYHSFPYYFRWNAIYTITNTRALVCYETDTLLLLPTLDVRYNYWGTGFQPSVHLTPTSQYRYSPVWTPGLKNGLNIEEEDAETLFAAAESDILAENYMAAEEKYRQIVSQYPESEYTEAAVKEMKYLKKLSNGDFASLKTYLKTEPNLQQDNPLGTLAASEANWCNVEAGNYPAAIQWLENIIANPPSFADSVFAVIDLGYTYMRMNVSGLKEIYTGRYPEIKPKSLKQFESNRDYLINELLKQKTSNANNSAQANPSSLAGFSIIPNPVVSNATIRIQLKDAANIQLMAAGTLGSTVATIANTKLKAGNHQISWDTSALQAGVYYVTLFINRQEVKTQKILIVK